MKLCLGFLCVIRNFILIGICLALVAGCGLPFLPTGIVPKAGTYTGSNQEIGGVVLEVINNEQGTDARIYGDAGPPLFIGDVPVRNGLFTIQFGQVGGTDCPTDGFVVYGVFESEGTARIRWQRVFACRYVGKPVELVLTLTGG